jgi:hypothetical protein
MIHLPSSRDQAQRRLDAGCVTELGLDPSDPMILFFEQHEGPFCSSKTSHCLLDIQPGDPTGSVFESTKVVRLQFGWPPHLLVLTDLVANGAYVYERRGGRVYNVDFEGGERLLLSGRLEPEFASFQSFLQWYFEDDS